MLHTPEEIKDVLWNSFTVYAKEIKFLERVLDEYWFEVILEEDITNDQLNDIGMDLHDSGLFDVINKGANKLLIKYVGESEPLTIDQMRDINESVKREYIEFEDSMFQRNKKLYSFLPANVANSPFVKSVYDQMIKNKKLTKKQWEEFKYILDHGKSKYNDKKLGTKN